MDKPSHMDSDMESSVPITMYNPAVDLATLRRIISNVPFDPKDGQEALARVEAEIARLDRDRRTAMDAAERFREQGMKDAAEVVRLKDGLPGALHKRWQELLDHADESDGTGEHVGFARHYRAKAEGVAEAEKIARALLAEDIATVSSAQWCLIHDCHQDDPNHEYSSACEGHHRDTTSTEERAFVEAALLAEDGAASDTFDPKYEVPMKSPWTEVDE